MSGRDGTNRRILSALCLMGFITILAQIVFLRKGIANFSGNELGLGIGLFSWLFWVGVGGLIFHQFTPKIINPERFLYITLLGLAALFPLTLIALDLVRPILGVQVGRLADIGFIAKAYFFLFAPFCLLDGADFALGAAATGKGKAGLILAAESLGAALGGIFFFTVGTRLFQGLDLAWFVLLLTSLVILWAGWNDPIVRYPSLLLGIAALVLTVGPGRMVTDTVLAARWDDFRILVSEDSPLGNLNWAVRPGEEILFYDGIPILTYPDVKSAEEAVGPGLISHTHPEKVLLVASRATGVLHQVLQHPVRRVDLVLLDRSVADMEARFIEQTALALKDPRVSVSTGDARRFLGAVVPGTYDLIIMDYPDPDTLQFNRLYTVEFFSLVKKALDPRGLFTFSTGEPANYIMTGQARYLAALDASLYPWFSHRIYYPLSRYVIVAGNTQPGTLTGELADEVALERGLDLKYMQSGYLAYDLSADRMAALPAALERVQGISANSDLLPSAVMHRISLWAERMGRFSYMAVFDRHSHGWMLKAGGFALLVLLFLGVVRTGSMGAKGTALLLVGGYAGITSQIVLLYLYQVQYGFLYSRIALLLSMFMAGTAAGALIPNRLRKRISSPAFHWMAYFLFLLMAVLTGWSGGLPESVGLALFLLLVTLAGVLTGLTFAAGSSLLETSRGRPAGGAAYGLDLAGAALGAVISGLILPLTFGLLAPLVFCFLLAVALGLGLAFSRG